MPTAVYKINKTPPDGTGSYSQCFAINCARKEHRKPLGHSAVCQKLTEQCKSTVLPFKELKTISIPYVK